MNLSDINQNIDLIINFTALIVTCIQLYIEIKNSKADSKMMNILTNANVQYNIINQHIILSDYTNVHIQKSVDDYNKDLKNRQSKAKYLKLGLDWLVVIIFIIIVINSFINSQPIDNKLFSIIPVLGQTILSNLVTLAQYLCLLSAIFILLYVIKLVILSIQTKRRKLIQILFHILLSILYFYIYQFNITPILNKIDLFIPSILQSQSNIYFYQIAFIFFGLIICLLIRHYFIDKLYNLTPFQYSESEIDMRLKTLILYFLFTVVPLAIIFFEYIHIPI